MVCVGVKLATLLGSWAVSTMASRQSWLYAFTFGVQANGPTVTSLPLLASTVPVDRPAAGPAWTKSVGQVRPAPGRLW
jgi:hypothetical protein